MSGEKKIYVKYPPAGENEIPLTCKETDTVHELALLLKSKAGLFGLSGDDININQVGLLLKDDKGEKRKLKFSEPVSVIQKNNIVEFTSQREPTYAIPVRYIESVNPVSLPYVKSTVVSDLAQYIRENIAHFNLAADVTAKAKKGGSEVVLMKIIDGHEQQLKPRTKVQNLKYEELVFKIKPSKSDEVVEIMVRPNTARDPVRFLCSEEHRVVDIVVKIKERIEEFGLTDDDLRDVRETGNEIILRTIVSLPGEESVVLDPFSTIRELKARNLEFNVQTRTMRIATLSDIKEKCHGQNIVLIGAPGHGKSSTINTIIKAVSGHHTPLASTWKAAAAGTAVLTPFKIDVKGSCFQCIDVPGQTLLNIHTRGGKDRSVKVIKDILDGKYPSNAPLDYWAWYSPIALVRYFFQEKHGEVHAVAIVHKGMAELDQLGSAVIEAAQSKGRGIPVFVIITHIDLITKEEVDKAVVTVSNSLGIDPSRIYRMSNMDHTDGAAKTTDKDNQTQQIVLGLLSAAEIYQKRGIVKFK